MKKLISLLLAATPFITFAESYSAVSTVTGITAGPDLLRVYTSDRSAGFESCTAETKKVAYALDTKAPGAELLTSIILSAKVSQQKIRFQTIGCYYGYSKITHVYFCDNTACN